MRRGSEVRTKWKVLYLLLPVAVVAAVQDVHAGQTTGTEAVLPAAVTMDVVTTSYGSSSTTLSTPFSDGGNLLSMAPPASRLPVGVPIAGGPWGGQTTSLPAGVGILHPTGDGLMAGPDSTCIECRVGENTWYDPEDPEPGTGPYIVYFQSYCGGDGGGGDPGGGHLILASRGVHPLTDTEIPRKLDGWACVDCMQMSGGGSGPAEPCDEQSWIYAGPEAEEICQDDTCTGGGDPTQLIEKFRENLHAPSFPSIRQALNSLSPEERRRVRFTEGGEEVVVLDCDGVPALRVPVAALLD